MELMSQEPTNDLIPYEFNQKLFDLLKGNDYEALKRDIKKNGIKVELHILPPDKNGKKVVICGQQRLKIAKELKIKHLRCKTVFGLDTPQQIREYVILDNLLRRQLTPEKQAFLLDDLSKQYENKENQPRTEKGKFTVKDNMSSADKEDVNEKTAKKVNVSAKTVQRARAYVKAKKENPKKYKNMKISKVLADVKKEKKKHETAKKAKDYKLLNNDIQIIHGDFRKKCKDLENESIDLIFTDPPYPKEFLDMWKDLAELSRRLLKPGGFCIAYCGHFHIDKVLEMMSSDLNLYWMCALVQKTQTVVHSRNVICTWKPILIYYKEPLKIVDRTFKDVFSFKREKSLHDWQQAEADAKYLIDFFSDVGDLVLDPFAGSGTIPKCCKDNKRRCIAMDIDKECIDIIKGRIVESDSQPRKV